MNHRHFNRGLAHLSPTPLDDGDYAYFADETTSWWVVDVAAIESLGVMLDEDEGDQRWAANGGVYSHWCAVTVGEEIYAGDPRLMELDG